MSKANTSIMNSVMPDNKNGDAGSKLGSDVTLAFMKFKEFLKQ